MSQLTSASRLDEILHAMVFLGMTAAAIFVKNPTSQAHAASIINLTNTVVLPLADQLLAKPTEPAAS